MENKITLEKILTYLSESTNFYQDEPEISTVDTSDFLLFRVEHDEFEPHFAMCKKTVEDVLQLLQKILKDPDSELCAGLTDHWDKGSNCLMEFAGDNVRFTIEDIAEAINTDQ